MNNKSVYCKTKEGFKVKVGTFYIDENTGKWLFIKNKPHRMKVLNGYGIQKDVTSDTGKTYNIEKLFKKHPEVTVVIRDADTGETFYSTAADWIEHQWKGNFGDGKQVFLSVDYMRHENTN